MQHYTILITLWPVIAARFSVIVVRDLVQHQTTRFNIKFNNVINSSCCYCVSSDTNWDLKSIGPFTIASGSHPCKAFAPH